MKFGETIYQRSIPKWSAYNLRYNELKKLIKLRTTEGVAIPTPIPGQSTNRWTHLEDELFTILKDQHDNIGLFLRSKYGEVERRLVYLEKQIQLARKTARSRHNSRNIQARRYQKLVEETDEIREDIQALSRFAAVQKTGFRKILKKYRKWTGSTTLQSRLERDVFSDSQLDLDLTQPMQRLSTQTSILTNELEGPMLKGEMNQTTSQRPTLVDSDHSAVLHIIEAESDTPLYFDACISTTPFGKAAGTATYWIHPDNLDEAKVLLLRYVKQFSTQPSLSRGSSTMSLRSQSSGSQIGNSDASSTHVVFYDNVQRFLKDSTANKPSKAALVSRWSQASEAVVTASSLSHERAPEKVLRVKRKDLRSALQRDGSRKEKESMNAINVRFLQDYLREHRDIKPLAETHFNRLRFAGITNSSKVGTWATLDTELQFSSVTEQDLGSSFPDMDHAEAFPHAVLEFRWEFGRKPEVVHVFDTSHLAERVHDFTTETAAVWSQNKDLLQPAWTELLQKDIRKVPLSTSSRVKRETSITGTTSGPSESSQVDSVFSETHDRHGPSDTSPTESPGTGLTDSTALPSKPARAKRKRARIDAKSPARPEVRYYSEYDDPDSELYQHESYAIYVDPNEHFPGAETISKVFASMYDSLGKGKARVLSWIPLSMRDQPVGPDSNNERTALLRGRLTTKYLDDNDGDSSDSDSTPSATSDDREGIKPGKKGKGRKSVTAEQVLPRLSRRQRALDKSLTHFYTGLIALGYVLLAMSGILLASGRKKAAFEVDIGAIIGVVAAQVCVILTGILIYMRKTKLGAIHWGIVVVAIAGIVIAGVGLLVATVARLA